MAHSNPTLLDDLRDDLVREALERPATRPARPESWNNWARFTDGGYLARVVRQRCLDCGGTVDCVQGIYHVELADNGTRRLQALDPRAQWPLQQWPMELEVQSVPHCAACLRMLGFELERPAPATYSLRLPS